LKINPPRKEVIPLNTTLEVTDLFRGAYLLASGADLAGVRLRGRGRPLVLFSFTGRDLARLDRDYRRGRALVNPLELREALNHLRDVMFARLRQPAAAPAGGRKRARDDSARHHRGHQARY
jgi:hypothetical protein